MKPQTDFSMDGYLTTDINNYMTEPKFGGKAIALSETNGVYK